MVHEATGFRVWWLEPVGMLTQVGHVVRVEASVADFLSGPVTEALLARRSHEGEPLFIVHEWSRVESYTKATRTKMTQWGLDMRHAARRIFVHLGPRASPLLKMGVSVATGALSLAGVHIRLTDDIGQTLREHGVSVVEG